MRIITRRGRRTVRLTIALATALALTVGIGVATGAIPSSNGTIHACFAKAGGAVRVIDKAKQQNCKSSEQTLNWNQKGVAGAQGPAGPAGPRGPKGDPGAGGTTNPTERVITISLAPGATSSAQAPCPDGTKASGGGFDVINDQADVIVKASASITFQGQPVGWFATFTNRTAQTQQVNAIAICV